MKLLVEATDSTAGVPVADTSNDNAWSANTCLLSTRSTERPVH